MREIRQQWAQKVATRGPEVLLILGAVLMLAGAGAGAGDALTALYRVGMVAATFGATGTVSRRCRTSERILEDVRQMSYDEGYADGCEVSRASKVVAIDNDRPPSSRRRLPVDRPTHQLGEQRHVVRSPDRVG